MTSKNSMLDDFSVRDPERSFSRKTEYIQPSRLLQKDKQMQPHTEIVNVSPEQAAIWLQSLDSDQRKLRKESVDRFARDMQTGAWTLTHQSIAFNVEGKLVDGQHRLQAVCKSGVTVPMMVCRNLQADFNAPIDQGLNRRISDMLKLSNQTIAATSVLYRLLNTSISDYSKRSTAEIKRTYDMHATEIEACMCIVKLGLVPACVAGAMAFAYMCSPRDVLGFCEAVRDGDMLAKDSPALVFRNWCGEPKRRAGGTQSTKNMILVSFNCLAAHLQNTTLTKLYASEVGYNYIVKNRNRLVKHGK